MSPIQEKFHSTTGTVALLLALMALVASAAGVGYAAGQIGTAGIQDNAITAKKIKTNAVTEKKIKSNAVTSTKVKDGSLTAADLVVEEKQVKPALLNGGEGDCIWTNTGPVSTLGPVTYRKDRFGIVRLAGTAQPVDGPGGDGACNPANPGQASDGIVFILPASHMPAKNQLLLSGSGNAVFIVGPAGLVGENLSLPPGAVYSGDTILLDGVTFDAAGSGVVLAKTRTGGRDDGSLLTSLGLGAE